MAKGYQENQAHKAALAALGKDLTRRSGSKCELCSSAGVPLAAFEVPPAPEEPDPDLCVFICNTCRSQIERPNSFQPETWRDLANTAWSDVPAVQVMAIRILRHLAPDHSWGQEILEGLSPEEEIESWADSAKIS